MVFSKEIIGLLFFRGAFDYKSLIDTSSTLFFYSLGLIGIALNTVSQRVYFSRKKIKIPIIVSILSVLLNIFLNIQLSKNFGIIGLSVGTSIVMILSGLSLSFLLTKDQINISKNTVKYGIIKSLTNSIVVILTAKFIYNFIPNNITLLFIIIISIIVYIYLGVKTEIVNIDDLKKVVKKKRKL